MKSFANGLVLVILLALLSHDALSSETFLLVRVSDMTRESTFQVMSAAEFKEFQKQLQQEGRFFQKAVAQAAEKWREDKETTPFPGPKLAPRKVVGQPESFPTREKAEERLGLYEERESRKRIREADKTSKRPSEAEKAKIERELDKQIAVRRAADLVGEKLSALAGVEIAPAADPFAEKDEKAPVEKKEAGDAVKKAL